MKFNLRSYKHNVPNVNTNEFLVGGKIELDENYCDYGDRTDERNPFADRYLNWRSTLESPEWFDLRLKELLLKLTLSYGEFDFHESCSIFDSIYLREDFPTSDITRILMALASNTVFENVDFRKYRKTVPNRMAFEFDFSGKNCSFNYKVRETYSVLFDVEYRFRNS